MGSGNQLKPWLDVLYRRRYWILVPGLLGLIGGVVALSQMPKVYRASTTVLLKPQIIPEGFVPNTASTRVRDGLAILSISIVSRRTLEPVARELNLIGPDAKEPQIRRAVGRLATAVQPEIDPLRPPKWFKINVEDGDPVLAARVANSLAGAVAAENTNSRAGEASAALATAQRFLADVKARLQEQEARVARYRESNLLQLPEQSGANMALLNGLTTRISAIDSEIRRQQDLIFTLQMMPQAATHSPSGAPLARDPAVARYEQLQRELADLELRYTSINPDVARKRSELQAWAAANPQVLAPPSAPASPDGDVPEGATATDVQILTAERAIKRLEADKVALQGQLGTYEDRITSAPSRQTEVENLTRDLETLRRDHDNWLNKELQARRALSIELDNQGEHFQIQDIARVPGAPFKPVPILVILTGLGIGLALGAAVSFVLEFLDNSVRTEEDFESAFPDLPLLAAIPDLDRTTRKRKRKSSGRRAAALVLVALALPFLY